MLNLFQHLKITFFVLLFPFLIKGQSNIDTRLHIKGKTFNSVGKVHKVSIRIVHDDGVVDTILSNNGKYNLHLEFNHKIY